MKRVSASPGGLLILPARDVRVRSKGRLVALRYLNTAETDDCISSLTANGWRWMVPSDARSASSMRMLGVSHHIQNCKTLAPRSDPASSLLRHGDAGQLVACEQRFAPFDEGVAHAEVPTSSVHLARNSFDVAEIWRLGLDRLADEVALAPQTVPSTQYRLTRFSSVLPGIKSVCRGVILETMT